MNYLYYLIFQNTFSYSDEDLKNGDLNTKSDVDTSKKNINIDVNDFIKSIVAQILKFRNQIFCEYTKIYKFDF